MYNDILLYSVKGALIQSVWAESRGGTGTLQTVRRSGGSLDEKN